MVCINKVKNQIMKKAKWISFGCLLRDHIGDRIMQRDASKCAR